MRLRNQTQEPPEIILVGTVWNRDLVASEKSERSANAIDRRPVRQMVAQEISELLLRTAANSYDNVFWSLCLDLR